MRVSHRQLKGKKARIKEGLEQAIKVLRGLGNLEDLVNKDELDKLKDLMAEVKIDIKKKK